MANMQQLAQIQAAAGTPSPAVGAGGLSPVAGAPTTIQVSGGGHYEEQKYCGDGSIALGIVLVILTGGIGLICAPLIALDPIDTKKVWIPDPPKVRRQPNARARMKCSMLTASEGLLPCYHAIATFKSERNLHLTTTSAQCCRLF